MWGVHRASVLLCPVASALAKDTPRKPSQRKNLRRVHPRTLEGSGQPMAIASALAVAEAESTADATAAVIVADAAVDTAVEAAAAPTSTTQQRMATIVFRREREPVLKRSRPLLLPGFRPLCPPAEQLSEWLREEWNQLDEQKLPYQQAAAAIIAERVPSKQPVPQRSHFDSDDSFATALHEHKQRMRQRRQAKERLREQARPHRDRTGRDQCGRAHHSRDRQREQRKIQLKIQKAELQAKREAAHAAAVQARMNERAAMRTENEISRSMRGVCYSMRRTEHEATVKRMEATEKRKQAWADIKQLRKRPKQIETTCATKVSRRTLPLE